MAKKQYMFTFPEELLREPIIYTLGQQFRVVPNILRADISEEQGWLLVELDGEDENIEQGIAWAMGRGVRVDTISETSDKTRDRHRTQSGTRGQLDKNGRGF